MDYHSLLRATLCAKKNNNVVIRDKERFELRQLQQWISFYDLLKASGESNSSQAFKFIQREFPEFAAGFRYLKFPGRGKHTSWAFPVTHYQHLADVFTILAEVFPSGHTVPKKSKYKDQPSIPLHLNKHLFELPPTPPLPPIPEEATPQPKKKKKADANKPVVTLHQGKYKLGHFGWYWLDKRLYHHHLEFPVVVEMLLMKAKNFIHKQIAVALNQEGQKNREGRFWTTEQVTSVLEGYKEMSELHQAQCPNELIALQAPAASPREQRQGS